MKRRGMITAAALLVIVVGAGAVFLGQDEATAPAGSAGMTATIDPETGEFVPGEVAPGDVKSTGGDDLEEAAVCYLQILLADYLTGVGRARLMRDMDAWGYSFRLGSSARWFEEDAADAKAWLRSEGLIRPDGVPCWVLRR